MFNRCFDTASGFELLISAMNLDAKKSIIDIIYLTFLLC